MAATDLMTMTKQEALDKVGRLKNSLMRYKEDAKKAGAVGIRIAGGAAGGIGSGVLQHYRPELWEGSGMPTDASVALLAGGASFFQKDETASDMLVSLAIGFGAPALSRMTAKMLAERESGG